MHNNQKNDQFIMLPKVDFCFKELMRNQKLRNGFIAALIDVAPVKIEKTMILNPYLPQEDMDEKLGILDVRVLLMDGTQMDMEMQVAYFEDWDKRIVFYLGKMYTDQIRSGESYEVLKKCIHVSILDFIHFQDCHSYRTIDFRDDIDGDVYSDLLEIKILELKKLSGKHIPSESATVYDWMRFFSGKTKEDFENMAKENEYFKEGYDTLLKISADDQKRMEYEARERAIRDYNSQISNAEKRGESYAWKLAKQIIQAHIAGKSHAEIAEEYHLPIEKIEDILGE